MRRLASGLKNLALNPCLGDRGLRRSFLRLCQPALFEGSLKLFAVIIEGLGRSEKKCFEFSPTPEILAKSGQPPL